MAKSIPVATKKKRGRPPTTGKGTRVTLRLHTPEITALDQWAAANGCTRAEALRRMAMAGLDALVGERGKR
ncbi:MAG: hypothetical protein FWD12_16470 [Alphaproteobacteria bacterium]|nr:hypothetical protein [Alphaproteobacteria bacterium]